MFGGDRAGVLSLSPQAVGSRIGCRGGACRPHCGLVSPGKSAGGPLEHRPAAGGGQPVAAPKSAGRRGSEVLLRRGRPAQGQMVWITFPPLVFTRQGLARSGLGKGGCGHQRQDGADTRGLSRFLPPPLEGCGPRRGALSMVRVPRRSGPCRAPAFPSLQSFSPTFRLFSSHCLWPPGSGLSFLLGFVLLFLGGGVLWN